MNIDSNDPRLTAFVLGELEPDERAIVEALLIASADSRHAVEEIRMTTQWLSEQLHEESRAHASTAELNHRVVPHSILTPTPPPRPWWRKMPSRFQLVAAGILVAAGLALVPTIWLKIQPLAESRQVAITAAPAPHGKAKALRTPVILRSVKSSEPDAPRLADSFEPVEGQDLPTASAPGMVATVSGGDSQYYYKAGAEQRLAALKSVRQKLGEVAAPAGGQSAPRGYDSRRARMAGARAGSADGLGRQSLGQGQDNSRALGVGKDMPVARSIPGGVAGGTQAPGAGGQKSADNLTAQSQNAPEARALDESESTVKLAKRKQEAIGDAEQSKLSAAVESKQAQRGQADAAQEGEQGQAPNQLRDEQLALAPVQLPAPVAEVYAPIVDNAFQLVSQDRQSTFSIDVDTASYSNIRRFLNHDTLPPPDAVRIEEMLNYFPYHDAPPPDASDQPFAVHVDIAGCPWNAGHRLARIGIAAKPIDQSRRPASNLVFLVDVSGSMDEPNKLPLVQWGLQRMVEQLNENDRVALVVYATASGMVLPSTSCMKKAEIMSAIGELHAAGSTNGGAGIQLAYDTATRNFIKNGTNRVILATDGDFNVGVSDDDELVKLIAAKAKSGVFLSVLGFGMGNIKDAKLEKLADKGNGHFAYIDSPREAYKVLVEEMGSTLVTVAKDVKIQVDFVPERVAEFRLIGYENRALAHRDFADDTKDAGEIGAGHHVTALYELTPGRAPVQTGLAQQKEVKLDSGVRSESQSFTVKLRYKKPDQDQSVLIEYPVIDAGLDFGRASGDLKFAAAVAGFGMLLRDSRYKGSLTFEGVLEIAGPTLADDPSGYRREFTNLVRKAQAIKMRPLPAAPAR